MINRSLTVSALQGPTLRGPTQGRSCQTGLMEPRGSKPPALWAAAQTRLNASPASDLLTLIKCM